VLFLDAGTIQSCEQLKYARRGLPVYCSNTLFLISRSNSASRLCDSQTLPHNPSSATSTSALPLPASNLIQQLQPPARQAALHNYNACSGSSCSNSCSKPRCSKPRCSKPRCSKLCCSKLRYSKLCSAAPLLRSFKLLLSKLCCAAPGSAAPTSASPGSAAHSPSYCGHAYAI
jgi:hypothetical protein